ncbi:MAG: hypothetical protein ABSE89_05070 [Sedimentisphaerales bacterium]
MRFFKQIKNWARKSITPLIFAILFILLGLALDLPPYEKFIVWEGRLELAAKFILATPLFIFTTAPLVPTLIWLGSCGFIIGLVFQFLWLKGKSGKIVIIIILLLNVPPGLFFFFISNARYEKPESCEKYFSQTNGLKIVAYPEKGFLGNTQLFYLATYDAGNHWNQIMHFRTHDPINPNFDNLRYLDPNNYWVWMGWQLAVTHNGGKTWFVWNPRETWKSWRCCNYRLIREVSFESAQNGMMFLDPIGAVEKSHLYTNDGGKTWKENKE